MGKGKNQVAIESTYDYTDSTFHQHLLDVDIKNPDGSYGHVGHLYRIVDLDNDGRVKAFDDRVFKNEADVKTAVAQDSSLELISYDAMINKAYKTMTQKAIEKASMGVKPWKPTPQTEIKQDKGFDR